MSDKHQLPEAKGFHQETSIYCLSHHAAKEYLLQGDHIESLGELRCPATEYHVSDGREGMSFHGSHGSNASLDKHHKEHDEHMFLNFLIEHIRDMQETHPVKHFVFFVPKDMSGLTHDKLPKDLQDMSVVHPLNLWHATPLELVERIKG